MILIYALFLALIIVLGSYLSIELPNIDSIFDRKPFNCRPCLTFWMIIVSSIVFSMCEDHNIVLYAGIFIAFIVFVVLKIIERNNIDE